METLALACQKCGATVQAAAGMRFVTCSYCKSNLEIVLHPGSAQTRLVRELQAENERLSREVEAGRIRDRIHELDRAWAEEREGLMVRDQDGGRRAPSPGGAIFTAVFSVAAAAFWYWIVSGMGASAKGFPDMRWFAVLPLLVGLGSGWFLWNRAQGYRRALESYEAERADLVHRLRAAGGEPPPGV